MKHPGEMLAQMGIPEGADPVEAVAQMPEDARAQMTESMGEKFRDMPDSMITQAAVSYVQAEYEALGEDIDELQMNTSESGTENDPDGASYYGCFDFCSFPFGKGGCKSGP